MSQSLDLSQTQLLTIPRGSFGMLEAALLRDVGPHVASSLQQAGYAAGEPLFAAFQTWLADQGRGEASELGLEEFEEGMSAFFRDLGWGVLKIGTLHDSVATLDSDNWGGADPAHALDQCGCHYATGLFAYFFGRVANAPVSVLEVECRSAGSARCRFLMGSADVMMHLYDALSQGESYETAAAEV